MALYRMEGFDLVATPSDLVTNGWSYAEGSIAPTGNQFGGQAINLGTSSGTVISSTAPSYLDEPYQSLAFWVSYEQLPTATTALCTFAGTDPTGGTPNTGTGNASLAVTKTGTIKLYTGGVLRAETGVVISGAGTHIHIELRVLLAMSGGTVEVRVNEAVVLDLTGLDTKYYQDFNSVAICGGTGALNTYIDDVIISSDAAALPPVVGFHRIQTLLPDGAGTNAGWTGTFADVDDPLGAPHDGDASYITGTTLNSQHDFTFSDLAGTPTTIHAVTLSSDSRKTDVGTKGTTPYILSNAVQSFGTALISPEAYIHTNDVFGLNPDGDVAWSVSSINALQAGMKITL